MIVCMGSDPSYPYRKVPVTCLSTFPRTRVEFLPGEACAYAQSEAGEGHAYEIHVDTTRILEEDGFLLKV